MSSVVYKALTALVLAASVYGLAGCDDIKVESASQLPVVTPTSILISKGQAVQFLASNGFDYEWRISDDHQAWGLLSDVVGDRTTYTSLYDPAEGAIDIQVLTLTSTIPGASRTNQQRRSTEAYIKHIRVAVSPKTVSTLYAGQSVNFTASNGSGYQWSLQHPEWGLLSSTSGRSVTYTSLLVPESNAAPVQVVTVRSFESEATANVTHR